MTQERGAGLPSWSLSPQNYTVAFGRAHFGITSGDMSQNAASGWFGPLAPLAPIAPKDVTGRSFDFPAGFNIATKPRSYEPVTVEDLRALAETYDLLRIVIETRKDQVERLPWSLRVKAGKSGPGAARLEELTRFFERPDGEHDLSVWLRMLLEDLLVLDSPTLWRQRRRNGELYALHPLDGATIKRVIDDWGRTPRPFEQDGQLVYPVAYQQVLKGYPAIDYSARDIIYAPRNLRPGRVYGLSPVEQIVMTVCTALKRQTFTLTHFTEGNIPESLIGVPENWTPDQIKNFQDYWDAYFTGDLAARRRAKFVPGGVAKTFIQTKEPELKGQFDEWLARVVCYAFSVSPQAFVSQVNRATGETHKEMAEEEGLRPILNWAKRLIDRILVEDFGEQDVEFVFGQDERTDPSAQAQILTAYVNAGVLTRNEARMKLGLAPVEEPAANELTVTTGAGATPLTTTLTQNLVKYDPNQPRDERGRWTAEAGGTADGDAASPPKPQSEKAPSVDLHGADTAGGQSAEFTEGSMSPAAALATPAALDVAGVAATLATTPGALATLTEAAEVAAPFLTNPATLAIAAGILVGVGAYYAYDYYQRSQYHQDQAGSDQNGEKKPTGDGEAEGPRAPRFKGDNFPPLDEPPENKPPLPVVPPTLGEGERRQDQPQGETPQKPSYKIGASDGGPGEWAKVNEGLTPEEAAYQEKATGAPRGTVYNVADPEVPKGVTSFDGYDPKTNTLIDAKFWNKWPTEKDFSTDSVMRQAKRQIRAAKGTNIVWKISSPEIVSKLKLIFHDNDISEIALEPLNP